jgi:hypothetical protein
MSQASFKSRSVLSDITPPPRYFSNDIQCLALQIFSFLTNFYFLYICIAFILFSFYKSSHYILLTDTHQLSFSPHTHLSINQPLSLSLSNTNLKNIESNFYTSSSPWSFSSLELHSLLSLYSSLSHTKNPFLSHINQTFPNLQYTSIPFSLSSLFDPTQFKFNGLSLFSTSEQAHPSINSQANPSSSPDSPSSSTSIPSLLSSTSPSLLHSILISEYQYQSNLHKDLSLFDNSLDSLFDYLAKNPIYGQDSIEFSLSPQSVSPSLNSKPSTQSSLSPSTLSLSLNQHLNDHYIHPPSQTPLSPYPLPILSSLLPLSPFASLSSSALISMLIFLLVTFSVFLFLILFRFSHIFRLISHQSSFYLPFPHPLFD